MCGRYQLTTPLDELVEVFDVPVPTFDAWPARYNLAPTQEAPAVVAGSDGVRRLGLLRWGLVPGWADDPSVGSRLINARAETVASKPAFRDAFRSRRCVVPMTGFYEWRRNEDGSKTPFLIRPPGGRVSGVAGLWERWDGGDSRIHTFTVITTTASRWMAALHDRMPVLLDRAAATAWLSGEGGVDGLRSLLVPAADDALEAFEVSTAVNSPRNDRVEVASAVPGGERIPQGNGRTVEAPD